MIDEEGAFTTEDVVSVVKNKLYDAIIEGRKELAKALVSKLITKIVVGNCSHELEFNSELYKVEESLKFFAEELQKEILSDMVDSINDYVWEHRYLNKPCLVKEYICCNGDVVDEVKVTPEDYSVILAQKVLLNIYKEKNED